MIEGFLQYLEYEKRYSKHTLTAYRKDLEQFQEFLQYYYDTDKLHSANFQMIRSWIVQLVNAEVAASSIKRKLSSLKSYFKYSMVQGEMDHNPALDIQVPSIPERLPAFLSENEAHQLLDEIVFPETFEGNRDRCILETFYATGMRLSELIGIGLKDLDRGNMQLRVMGKRSKERFLPVSQRLIALYDAYLPKREALAQEGEESFFVTSAGKKLYPKLVYLLVNAYLGKVTTQEKKSPHVLRHTFATHMLNQGADINAVKELLGHANLAATQIYTHNTIEKLKHVYKLAHPRA